MTGGDSQRITALIRRQYKNTRQRDTTPEQWQALEKAYAAHWPKWRKAVAEMAKAAELLENLPDRGGSLPLETMRLVWAQAKRLRELTEVEE